MVAKRPDIKQIADCFFGVAWVVLCGIVAVLLRLPTLFAATPHENIRECWWRITLGGGQELGSQLKLTVENAGFASQAQEKNKIPTKYLYL